MPLFTSALNGEKMGEAEDKELEEIRRRKLKELERELEERHSEKSESAAGKPLIDKPVEVEDRTLDQFVKTHLALVVDCWAPWCGPCLMVAPIVEKLAKKYAGRIAFGKLNVDENQMTALKYQIMGIPTLLLFKNGRLVDRIIGFLPQPALERKVAALLKL
jgi:thioredoxin 1